MGSCFVHLVSRPPQCLCNLSLSLSLSLSPLTRADINYCVGQLLRL